MGNVKYRFCFSNLFSFLLAPVLFFFLFFFLLFLVILNLWFSWISVSVRDVLFRKISMFGYLLLFSFLYLDPQIYLSLSRVLHFSFSFSFLQLCSIGLCPSSNCWSLWYTNLCISKHFSVSSSYLLHSFSSHRTLFLKSSAIFFLYGSILFEG